MTANPARVIERFVDACQRDPRVVAAFLYGSRAKGTEDSHSDIDLGVITTDESHHQFLAERAKFASFLGEPLFLEDFGTADMLFVILEDATEVELAFGRENDFLHLAPGPIRILVDKHGLLSGVTLQEKQPDPAEQRETLRRLIIWFWHDVSHFTTAIARGQLWWAFGQLEALRRFCITLTRLRHDFRASSGGDEPYFKVHLDLPLDQLAPFAPTVVPLDLPAILKAGRTLVDLYRTLAPPLAAEHGLSYPTRLERVILERLDRVTPP